MTQQKKPTMKDVAREADVALGTVSKVINGLPVGDAHRARVEAAIEKLGYRVNTFAQGMRSGKTVTVALILPNLTNPFFGRLANDINRALSAKGRRMMLLCTDNAPEQEQALVQLAEQQKVDGILCLSLNPALTVPEGIPFVSIDRQIRPGIPCVCSDNYVGGWLAAQTLADHGCKRLAMLYIGSPVYNEPGKRRDGFIASCQARNLTFAVKSLLDGDPYQGFAEFLSAHCHDGTLEFDGLFCVTDALAHQVLGTLRQMEIQVPEQVQLIGFDGCRHFGDLEMTCSTIVQPVHSIAATCVDLLLQEKPALPPSLVCLPVHFAPGGTTMSLE